jgi:hypothetical protein
MNTVELHELYDISVLRHGFTRYNRDYDFLIDMQPLNKRISILRFKHVYRLKYKSALAIDVLKDSLDDGLIDFQVSKEHNLTGHVWGANYALAYPGFSVVGESQEAKELSEMLGVQMHEVLFETNVYEIRFLAHDFELIEAGESLIFVSA